jgi:undecaprenyl-diphosphatase
MARLVCAALSLLILTAPVLSQEKENLDVRIFRGINNLQDPSRDGFIEYLDLTSLPTFGAIPVGFAVVGLATQDRAVFEVALLSMTAQLTSLGLTTAFKELLRRPRPFEALSDVRAKHRWSAIGFSFPSGHTSQAFAIATIFSLKFRKGSVIIPAVLWASAISYGRIFLGVHYPSDVAGGAFIGIASGFFAWSLRAETGRIAVRTIAEQRVGEKGLPQAEILRIQIPL